jgi:beta-galactosidase/beta-glucuronidase|tara:strand:+ start:580 stop:2331 length:1752 start_codon:yes stop_codon:yes gene_type:complete
VQLRTKWASEVDENNPLPEYPRPQLVRSNWVNLNGVWGASVHYLENEPDFADTIIVPFPIGSELSGFNHVLQPDEVFTMRRSFHNPISNSGERLRIHFGAVDWACTVLVNGILVGTHAGGFDPFFFDITDALIEGEEQEIIVSVEDPTDTGNQPVGKQTLNPFAIQYTAVAGIWQTVWLEPVPITCIERVICSTNITDRSVTVTSYISNASDNMSVALTCSANGSVVTQTQCLISQSQTEIVLNIADLRLWSPDDPFLYDLQLQIIDAGGSIIDSVDSYFGAREITCEPDKKGHHRLFLNGEPVFHLGLLDQGWWPEGLFTAPTDDALKFDIEATLAMGFNTIRKHVKVEPARWYWHADRLGVLVWQDMPSTAFNMVAFGKELAEGIQPEDMEWDLISPGNDPEGFRIELDAMLDALESFPSIVVWVPFNEAWGQHNTDEVLTHVMMRDPSRLVDGPSGWTDTGTGHMRDHHLYQDAEKLPAHEDGRATVYGEFGGISLYVDGHVIVEKGWGYTKTETAEDLRASYSQLLGDIAVLIPEGLAGVIYTQTTDVESEINGLLTYDRNYKLDPEILRSIHSQIVNR